MGPSFLVEQTVGRVPRSGAPDGLDQDGVPGRDILAHPGRGFVTPRRQYPTTHSA